MNNDLFGFITSATREQYLQSRHMIVTDSHYDPYSGDLGALEALLGEEKFEEVVDFNTLNILLSPRAHLIKRMALLELGREEEARFELIVAQRFLECLDQTGDGSAENPYLVVRISDELDYLSYIGAEFAAQALLKPEGRYLDAITTTDGRTYHFDITDCYLRMQALSEQEAAAAPAPEPVPEAEDPADPPAKKWWKFW